MDRQIYRDAPEVKVEAPQQRRLPRSVAVIAALVVLSASSLLKGALVSQRRFETNLFAVAVTVIGFAAVVTIKLAHAAWKKRHDARLMVEWERRLEEMK